MRTKDSNGKWSETATLDLNYIGAPVNDCNAVLSSELIVFNILKKDKTVQLSWQTAAEHHVSHFDIERSNDGKTFAKIGEQKAVGGAHKTAYTALDDTPQYGINYYRLKIVDTDGKVDFSKTQSLSFGKDLVVRIFPNPIQEELTITISGEAKTVVVTIADLLGQVVFRQNTEGDGLLTIKTTDWQKGVYILRIGDGKTIFQQKIIKQ